ncbi:glycoside hydrolase family 43 protein [Brachybacterium sp. GCM10030252]|uniref:glycoside hydrolase family 43 protein n=1 Tax=Brachybacterium sp. GCM10030252 TaxID=3273380 RepID=UPI00361BEB04
MSTVSRRGLLTATATLSAGGALALSPGPAGARPPEPDIPPDPEFTEVSVHDPSVILTSAGYYVFGSHLAAARTDDLLHWESVADLVTPENPLFEDVTVELAEAFEWANTDTLWAADVSETPDGRFRMYYCACEGSSPRSAMGTAIADHIEGPYVDEGIFLRSGMWDQPSEDGRIYDARIHPNAIDPHAFVDADGRHRLVYGSYSGGIFLLDLDPATGRPTPGQGYGIHLMGGNHARIEAPYILHSPRTGYYYLMVTFGGLDADGGYNVRVGRSRTVEGPYLDPMGQDLREAKADPDLPLFDDASIEPYAAKLMGNHRYADADEDGPTSGYVSPGHVSAWTDPEGKDAFLFFHSRFPGTGELHQVRVHRLHFTREGWPVVAPHRHAGEPDPTAKAARLHRHDLKGTWQFLDHGRAISPDIVASEPIELHRDGSITGAVSGRWRLEAGHRASLTVDGQEFDGVFTLGWRESAGAWTPTFSVLGADGRALWGTREV